MQMHTRIKHPEKERPKKIQTVEDALYGCK